MVRNPDKTPYPFFDEERKLMGLRWLVRQHPAGIHPGETETVLQALWVIEVWPEGAYRNVDRPRARREEWVDVPYADFRYISPDKEGAEPKPRPTDNATKPASRDPK